MGFKKDDALNVKEMAEKMILQKDFGVARLLARRARNLDPNNDDLRQLLETIDAYLAAEERVGAEVDWYRILGAQPLDDDETIRKCYKKMAFKLHPDKNKSVGAEGAFSLVAEAWTILSDKDKRATYDQKYRLAIRAIPVGIPSIPASQNSLFNTVNLGERPSVPGGQNGLFNAVNRNDRDRMSAAHTSPTPRPPPPASHNGLFNAAIQKNRDHTSAARTNSSPRAPPKSDTFWTVCSLCSTKYEYLATYRNCNLVCGRCKKPFYASEIPAPSVRKNASSTSRPSQMKQQSFNSTGLDRNCHVPNRTPMSAVNSSLGSGAFSMPGGLSSVPTSVSTAGGVPGLFMRPSANLKRKHEDSAPVMREEMHFGKTHAVERTVAGSAFQSSGKKRCTGEHKVDGARRDVETEMASKKGMNSTNGFGSLKISFDAGKVSAAGNSRRNGSSYISQQQLKNILAEKAQKLIRKKLDEWKESRRKLDEWKEIRKRLDERYPSSISKNTVAEARVKEKEKAVNGVKPGPKEIVKSENKNKSISADSEANVSVSMNVPDPDFHDFDGDRIEDSFGENQVWAVYDDEDGMPRYYVFIHSVISKDPFQMKISWLSSKTNDELAPIEWVSNGFPKTTGDLRLGKRAISNTLNSFSHRVKWTKGSRGLIHVYPKKGDVWALFRNWSLDWDVTTNDDIIHQYDMVEVLEDYSEEHGVNVAPLVKVAGFKTVFRQNADPRKIRNIPRAEMFRFSHQVPSYLLTGQEGDNAPKGCLELDPASTPMELLQVTTDAPTQEDSAEDGQRKKVAGAQEGKAWPENLVVYKRQRLKEKREQ